MIEDVYEELKKANDKYGRYKKFEFHLHTPASHDYRLFKDKLYKELSEEEVIKSGKKRYLITDKIVEDLKVRYEGNEEALNIYENFKELISYYLIARKLYNEKVEAVIVCDHNTVDGFYKMESASTVCFTYLKEENKEIDYLFVLFGVEISCAEENHLVCIQDKKYVGKVKEYLAGEIISEAEGSYRDSVTLIKEFSKKFNSICYLAHHDNIDREIGSGAFKKALYSNNNMKLMGVASKSGVEKVKRRISNHNKNCDFTYILDGDSHELETIGKRPTWIKIRTANYNSFSKAIENRKVSIRIDEPKKLSRYIKGIYIEYGKDNFLVGDKLSRKNFMIKFSPELNCIIGGRGVGKSTILNSIDTILSREIDSVDELEFISKHSFIDILFEVDGKEYMVRFVPRIKDKDRYYYLDDEDRIENCTIKDGKIKLHKEWRIGYKIEDGKLKKIDDNKLISVMDKVFRRGYNVNRLVQMVEQDKISLFINEVLSCGISFKYIEDFEKRLLETQPRSYTKFLKDNLDEVILEVSRIQEKATEYIDGFNKYQENIIKIIQLNKAKHSNFYLKDLKYGSGRGFFENTNLSNVQVFRFICDISDKIGFPKFLNYLLKNEYNKIDEIYDIYSYVDYNAININVVGDKVDIKKKTKKDIFSIIKKELLKNKHILSNCILTSFRLHNDYGLEFNINNRERVTNDKPVLMKSIKILSLGQKVVALLTFVFEFGKYSGDNSVLIIDQPEDNLDNQYIYKNLVRSLKNLKNERQIIIVTHNSTIVTNADAEQVLVMESDNKKAWMVKCGYPEDKTIINYILNNLEGGVDAFKHKKKIYSMYLNK